MANTDNQKDQNQLIWNSISEREEALHKVVSSTIDSHNSQLNVGHERLLKMTIHINTLFLTGWIALLSAGKLNDYPTWRFNFFLWLGCGLHIISFAALSWVEWKVMRLHFETAKELNTSFEPIRTSATTKRNLLAAYLAKREPIPQEKWVAVIESDTSVLAMIESAQNKYEIENNRIWGLGRITIIIFFIAIITSTLGFILLIET